LKRLVLALILTLTPIAAQEHAAAGHEAAAAEGHHEADSTSLWKWVNFGLLAAVLVWAIAKNAPPFFQSRIAEIQKDINEAKEVRHEAETRAAAIEKRLANLDTELASMRADAKREMESEGARIQDETKRLVAKAGEQAEQEIASMSKAAENELRRHASLLALELAEKKLKARMSPEADASLVERFVAGLGAVSRN
jgi:F-type H+-transporting ATPase subunit b